MAFAVSHFVCLDSDDEFLLQWLLLDVLRFQDELHHAIISCCEVRRVSKHMFVQGAFKHLTQGLGSGFCTPVI